MRTAIFCSYFLMAQIVKAQISDLEKIRSYREKNQAQIYNDFISILKIPNVATDTANIRKNTDFLLQLMNAKGIDHVQLLEADEKNVPPVLYGEVNVRDAT